MVPFFWLVQNTAPRIDTIWPTSLIGLIGSFTALLSFFMLLVSLWRADKKPILSKIAEAQAFFTRELARVEKDVSERVSEQRAHIDETLDDYHRTVTHEINGWAKRFQDDHQDIERHEMAIGDIAGKLIESRTDRDHMNRRVAELAVKIDKNTEETRELERSMTKQLAETERRIIEAINERVKMIGGTR